jgi:CobQ-like glutamine amidotransferase family enzyme
MKTTNYQDKVATIVERDETTTTNLAAMYRHAPEQPIAQNVRDWLVKAALRRYYKPGHTGSSNLALARVKARSAR